MSITTASLLALIAIATASLDETPSSTGDSFEEISTFWEDSCSSGQEQIIVEGQCATWANENSLAFYVWENNEWVELYFFQYTYDYEPFSYSACVASDVDFRVDYMDEVLDGWHTGHVNIHVDNELVLEVFPEGKGGIFLMSRDTCDNAKELHNDDLQITERQCTCEGGNYDGEVRTCETWAYCCAPLSYLYWLLPLIGACPALCIFAFVKERINACAIDARANKQPRQMVMVEDANKRMKISNNEYSGCKAGPEPDSPNMPTLLVPEPPQVAQYSTEYQTKVVGNGNIPLQIRNVTNQITYDFTVSADTVIASMNAAISADVGYADFKMVAQGYPVEGGSTFGVYIMENGALPMFMLIPIMEAPPSYNDL